jgi:hypothetical protein
MVRKLWTDEKPKHSGYYWLKHSNGDIEVVEVKRGRVRIVIEAEECPALVHYARVKDMQVKWYGPIPYPSLHQANKHEAKLKELATVVIDCLTALDMAMDTPESPKHAGSRIARIANALNFANDAAMHITLGMSFEQMDALKRKRARMLKNGKPLT